MKDRAGPSEHGRAGVRRRWRRPNAWAPAAALLLGACGRVDASAARTLELRLIRPQNASDVFLNEELVFFFSADVDRASVTRESVRIRSAEGGEARGMLQVDGPQVRFVPAPVLAPDLRDGGYLPGTEYRVELLGFPHADGLRGVAGEPLSRTASWTFRTVAAAEPRTRLIFDDRQQDRFKPLIVFPPPSGPAEARYLIGPQGPVFLACEKPIDPASVRAGDFHFVSAKYLAVPVRARLLENESTPAVRPRPPGSVSAYPELWTRQPRAARIEITPRLPLAPGDWSLSYQPERRGRLALRDARDPAVAMAVRALLGWLDRRDFSLRDFSTERVLDTGHLPRGIQVDASFSEAGRGVWIEDFDTPRMRSPLAVRGYDGTAWWGDGGRVEVRWPRAAGSGADGVVRLAASEPRADVHATSLELPRGQVCALSEAAGCVVLRAQGRVEIAGRLERRRPASAPDPELAGWQGRGFDAPPLETLSGWLERTRQRGADWTVIVAGGDLVIDGELVTTTPLLLCAGGVIRIAGSVRGAPRQVFLLREGGGLDVVPPADLAPLEIDVPVGPNPLVRPLRLAVLSSPIPPAGGVRRWISAEARGSNGRKSDAWRVRYQPEGRGERGGPGEPGPVESPLELSGPGSLQMLIELEVEPGGMWDPPWVDSVRLSWEQADGTR